MNKIILGLDKYFEQTNKHIDGWTVTLNMCGM